LACSAGRIGCLMDISVNQMVGSLKPGWANERTASLIFNPAVR